MENLQHYGSLKRDVQDPGLGRRYNKYLGKWGRKKNSDIDWTNWSNRLEWRHSRSIYTLQRCRYVSHSKLDTSISV